MPGLWATRDFDSVIPPVAVLIVDDDDAMANALAAAVMAYGGRALVAAGGIGAFAIPESWVPHIVILDIEMPEWDGFSTAKAMRGSIRFARVPIVAQRWQKRKLLSATSRPRSMPFTERANRRTAYFG